MARLPVCAWCGMTVDMQVSWQGRVEIELVELDGYIRAVWHPGCSEVDLAYHGLFVRVVESWGYCDLISFIEDLGPNRISRRKQGSGSGMRGILRPGLLLEGHEGE